MLQQIFESDPVQIRPDWTGSVIRRINPDRFILWLTQDAAAHYDRRGHSGVGFRRSRTGAGRWRQADAPETIYFSALKIVCGWAPSSCIAHTGSRGERHKRQVAAEQTSSGKQRLRGVTAAREPGLPSRADTERRPAVSLQPFTSIHLFRVPTLMCVCRTLSAHLGESACQVSFHQIA